MTPSVIAAYGDHPPEKAIDLAVKALAGGDIIGVPTDTVYGLAADPFHTGASDRLFRLKGRPRSVELPVLVGSEEQALSLCTAVPASARRLMRLYWPGPLTLVLPRRPDLDADLGEEDATIGIRCPAHPVPLAICEQIGPIATTSANRHKEPALTTATDVCKSLGSELVLVLDAGTCDGLPSTVVDCTGEAPKVLREGRLSGQEITAGLE
ncbi:MAG TPA: L-threonylcarbamoyladenylate synthase [Acidimicrobiales bacterium]|nr:L-threonylcarbamoyladenylate synthase [Acidimicrobiales bacterium]